MALIFFFIVILLIFSLSFYMVGWANKRGRRGWLWGWSTFLIVFGIPFGGLPFNYVTQDYYCGKDGGVTIYKTLEKWKQENPGVSEILNPDPAVSQSAYFEKKYLGNKHYLLPDGSELIADYDSLKRHKLTKMIRPDESKVNWLNQRFIYERNVERLWFDVARIQERIIDQKTNELMVEYIDYDGKSLRTQESWFVIPLWTGRWSCERDGHKVSRGKFSKLLYLFKHQREVE